jgi:hypothetical protein
MVLGFWFLRTTRLVTALVLISIGWYSIAFSDFLVCVIADHASASHGSVCVSEPCYCGAENIGVASVIVAPFEFSDVQRQILSADFVETAHDATFQQRPKTIDRLSMDRAVHILASAMPDSAVLFQLAISGIFVSRDQADFSEFRYQHVR